MLLRSNPLIAAVICAAGFSQARAQTPRIATLDIGWENAVTYGDNYSLSNYATSPTPPTPPPRNFGAFMGIADIVSVNGKSARGNWVLRGRVIGLFPNPAPGQAIGDLGRASTSDIYLEILQPDGTRVGTITTSGFTAGPTPPGAPPGAFNFAVTGGTGAFLGTRGSLIASLPTAFRGTLMEEDPGYRRDR